VCVCMCVCVWKCHPDLTENIGHDRHKDNQLLLTMLKSSAYC